MNGISTVGFKFTLGILDMLTMSCRYLYQHTRNPLLWRILPATGGSRLLRQGGGSFSKAAILWCVFKLVFLCLSFTNDVVVPCQCRHCPISYRDLHFGGNWRCSKKGSWRRRNCQMPRPFHKRDLVQFQCCRYLADRQICSVQSRLVDNSHQPLVIWDNYD